MMKKFCLFIVVLLFAFPTIVLANPFLVCTPVPGDTVSHYLLKADGAAPITVPAFGNPDGTVMIHYDLAGFSNGNHNLEIAAANIWGESIFVPFDFTKAVPGSPLGLGLSSE